MKRMIAVAVLAAVASGAMAADNKLMQPIASAMAANDAEAKLNNGVKFYFAGQQAPKFTKISSGKTSQKTNAFNKTADEACNWAFLSSMLWLEKRAQQLGADAVVNITSNYGNVENASATEFECHEGKFVAGVAFKADFVRLDGKKK
jgi:uncharacterized protein YbjQ (UPF0145 family)